MHPAILYDIAKARTAEMRCLASQDAIARAARGGHRAQSPRHLHLAANLARSVVTVRAARGRPAPVQPAELCRACT